jgi:hypothetical protein
MQLHGSTEANLISAVRSAGRLRGQRVHSDTVNYWTSLLLIAELEVEIVQHSRP